MKILNLTQHNATAEQRAAGVYDWEQSSLVPGHLVRELLTFNDLPTPELIRQRAEQLADIANLHRNRTDESAAPGAFAVMIGGAPFLMGPLEAALREMDITVLYAFSERVSVDVTGDDGSVTKTSRFVHRGFVEAV